MFFFGGPGFAGPGGPRGGGGPAGVLAADVLTPAASFLGITPSTLQADLKSGKTLADEATANGKTVDGLVTALTADAKTKLDAAVTAGTITAAQEQTILSNLKDRVTNFVNNAKPHMGMGTKLQALVKRVV